MAWTATLNSVTKEGGNVVATITFSQNGESIVDVLRADTLDEASLMRFVRNKVAALTNRDTNATALLAKVGQSVTPEVDTQDELERIEFFTKLLTHQKALKAVALGLVAANAPAVVAAKAAVDAAFKPAFVTDRRFPI